MVIGFDGSRAFEKDKTGTENYSYQLLLNLSEIDKENEYIVYLRPQSQTVSPGWPGNFKFATLNWPRLWTQGALAKQTFKDNLDVLFIPAHTSPLIHKRGLKTVVTVHDLGAEYLPQAHQIKQQLYLKWIFKFQLKSATRLIAVSQATKDDLVKKVGCQDQNIEVIYEGYDEKLFKPVKGNRLTNSLKQFDLVKNKYFLFVGTVQPRKNLARLIQSFAKFLTSDHSLQTTAKKAVDSRQKTEDIRLVIAGGKGWMSDEIYRLPKKLGIETQVKFLGRVPDKDLPALYSGAIGLTFPSLFEGFGLPIIEAQACGCPVLTSNTSSMPEVGGKFVYLVDPYDIDSISRGMREIGEVRGIREKLIKKGFENIKRFSWEKCARETLEALEGVV